jgi:hypothetical protein
MSNYLKQTIQLSDKEIEKYLEWAINLQESHSSECDGPLDALSITFQITNIGTSVIAHTGNSTNSRSQIILRD